MDEQTKETFFQQKCSLRRKALAFLHNDTKSVDKIFNELAPRYKDRNGGYTRIIKMTERKGDNALQVILELV